MDREPDNPGREKPPSDPAPATIAPWPVWIRMGLVLAVLLGLNVWIATGLDEKNKPVRVPYSPTFIQQVRAGNVVSVSAKESSVEGRFRRPVARRLATGETRSSTRFTTEIPVFADPGQLSDMLQLHRVEISASAPDKGRSLLSTLLLSLLPTLLLVGLLVFIMRRATGGGAGMPNFGKSKARRVEPARQRLTFDDVAGIEEVKEELAEIVDFLRDPDRYRRLGGHSPKGVLLTGPPGTGKTLLVRALAGEAEVPFFSISASEFVEMFVGVGASRVRDLFEQAKREAPAIVFIDELDAIGRSRDGRMRMGGGNEEREQTLNQILTEMDGFDPNEGVIVLAATNKPEILDSALLRPGRFDRRVAVQPPDRAGRRAILGVHTRSIPLSDGVDLDRVAATTTGMVGADLANLANEAALLAAHRRHEVVTMTDFEDALEKIILGAERHLVMSPEQRRRTAYHEAGHALTGMLTPGADRVRKVSIVPHGAALGVTLAAPGADRFNYDRHDLEAKIQVALGGRAAEEIVFGDQTTGAEDDLRQLTEVARSMVMRWGMSSTVGPIALAGPEAGREAVDLGGASPEMQDRVEREVLRIVEQAHDEVTKLLSSHRQALDRIAQALLEHETLDEDMAYGAAALDARPEGVSS